jgi:predicted MFS family arabinose efflux permease
LVITEQFPFLTMTMAAAIRVFALFIPPFFLPLFASSVGPSTSAGGGLVGSVGAATVVGRILGGWTCDKIGTSNILMTTCFVNSINVLVIWLVSTTSPPLFVFALANGCANDSFFVSLPTAVAVVAAQSAAASIALMIFLWIRLIFSAPLLLNC